MWELTKVWYGDRLAADYRPASTDVLQQLLTTAGLTDDFWQLGA